MGVRAALAAGMTVWHFAGGAHVKAGYASPPASFRIIAVASMRELPPLFQKIGLSSGVNLALVVASRRI